MITATANSVSSSGTSIGGVALVLLALLGLAYLWAVGRGWLVIHRGWLRYPPCPHCVGAVRAPFGHTVTMAHDCGNLVTIQSRWRRHTTLASGDWLLEPRAQGTAAAMDRSPDTPTRPFPAAGESPAVSPNAPIPCLEQASHPQGWYPDPLRPQRQRWWDGSAWTDELASIEHHTGSPTP